MRIAFAFGSAFFAGVTSVLAKCGIRKTDSTVATAIRTGVVLVMVFAEGKQHMLREIPKGELRFICLSGIATGASWFCYYKALQWHPSTS